MKASTHLFLVFWIPFVISFSFGQEKDTGEMTIQDFIDLVKLMDTKRGSTVIIVHDHPLDSNFTQFLETWMSKNYIKQLGIMLDMVESVLPSIMNQVMEKRALKHFKSVLNIVALCYKDCLQLVLTKLSKVDALHGQGSLIRHFAKVMVINLNQSVHYLNYSDTDLDNVALAAKDKELAVKTLLWTNEGRSWASVGNISKSKTDTVSTEIFPNVYRGLNGRNLTIAAMEWTDFCRKDSRVNGLVKFTNMCRDLTEYLAKQLNFTYFYVQPLDMKWGEKLSDSSWDGILGMVYRKEADFAIIPFGQTFERAQVLSFSSILFSTSYKVAYLKEFSEMKDWVALVSGFKSEVYILGIITACWSVVLTLVLEKTVLKQTDSRTKSLLSSPRIQSIFDTLAVPLHRGSGYVPNATSQRIFLAAWWIFCIIMTTVYTGNLVAFLAISKETIPFRTLGELADNNEYKVLIEEASFIEDVLKVSSLPIHKKLWKRTLESRTKKYESVTEEVSYLEHQLQAGKNAWLIIEEQLQDTEQRVHSIKRMQGYFVSIDLRLPFPLNSPLEPFISEQLMRLYDAGLLEGLKKKWFRYQPITTKEQQSKSQLEMNDLKSALTASAIGICIAGVSLLFEKLYNNGLRRFWINHFKKRNRFRNSESKP